MEVQDVKIEDIKVGQRFRGEFGDIDDLAKNIKTKGLLQPITVDRELNLVAGERRLRACRKAKLETIPAVIRDVADEADAREIELFENLHRKELVWTERVALESRIHDLKKAEAKANGKPWSQKNTALVLGKSEAAVSQTIGLAEAMTMIPELKKCSSEKEARKKYRKAMETVLVAEALSKETSKTYKYVKWADKHYKIGDAITAMKRMQTGSIDFAEVDPPYAIDLRDKKSEKTTGIEDYNEIKKEDYPDFLEQTAKQVYRVLAPDRFCVWWYGHEWYETVITTLREAGFSVDTIPAIWCKTEAGGTTNAPQLNLARTFLKLWDHSHCLSQTIGLAEAMTMIPELKKCSSEKEARKKYRKAMETVLVAEALSKETSKTYKYVKWADKHYKIGDAITAMKRMQTGSIDFAEVDPPYAIDLRDKKSEKTTGIEDYNEIKKEDYPDFLEQTAKQVYRVLAPDRFCVWWYGHEWYETVITTLREAGFSVDTIPAIWCKTEAGGTTNAPQLNLARTYEPFLVARKGVPELRTRGRSNVFHFKPVVPTSKTHPTERPVPLIRELLDTFIFPGATVIVPFLGSGNSILASYANKCYAFGWDLSDEYKKGFLAKVNNMFEGELAELEKEEGK